jgi:hypothetical protein
MGAGDLALTSCGVGSCFWRPWVLKKEDSRKTISALNPSGNCVVAITALLDMNSFGRLVSGARSVQITGGETI